MMAIQRRILAVSTVLSFLGAAVTWLWLPDSGASLAFFLRLGAVAAAAWLAFDDVQRLPGWLLVLLPVVLIVVVRWPRFLFLLIPALVGWAILRRVLSPVTVHGPGKHRHSERSEESRLGRDPTRDSSLHSE